MDNLKLWFEIGIGFIMAIITLWKSFKAHYAEAKADSTLQAFANTVNHVTKIAKIMETEGATDGVKMNLKSEALKNIAKNTFKELGVEKKVESSLKKLWEKGLAKISHRE